VRVDDQCVLVDGETQRFEYEQRRAIRGGVQTARKRARPFLGDGECAESLHDRADLVDRERRERERRRAFGRDANLRACGGQAQHPRVIESREEAVQDTERLRVDPVDIVDRQHERLLVGHGVHQIGERVNAPPQCLVRRRDLRRAGEPARYRGVESEQRGDGSKCRARGPGHRGQCRGEIGGEREWKLTIARLAAQLHDGRADGSEARDRVAQQTRLAETGGRREMQMARVSRAHRRPRGRDGEELTLSSREIGDERLRFRRLSRLS
jgi:hypothetical protein